MLEVFKVPVEQLTPEAFEPFGQVISTFDEARPPLRVGTLQVREYNVTAAVADPVNPTLAEGRQRGHFACHDDAGQSFSPSRHCPSIFFVAPVPCPSASRAPKSFSPPAATRTTTPIPSTYTLIRIEI